MHLDQARTDVFAWRTARYTLRIVHTNVRSSATINATTSAAAPSTFLGVHGGLVFLEASVAVDAVVAKVGCVDLASHLEVPLVEDFLEHAHRDRFVAFLERWLGARHSSGQRGRPRRGLRVPG
jgi:hypothetical protein